MFDDCDCELCGVPASRSVAGRNVCDDCALEFDADEREKRSSEPPHWLTEVPAGLLGLVEEADEIETAAAG